MVFLSPEYYDLKGSTHRVLQDTNSTALCRDVTPILNRRFAPNLQHVL
jgi:hypothetical protein